MHTLDGYWCILHLVQNAMPFYAMPHHPLPPPLYASHYFVPRMNHSRVFTYPVLAYCLPVFYYSHNTNVQPACSRLDFIFATGPGGDEPMGGGGRRWDEWAGSPDG